MDVKNDGDTMPKLCLETFFWNLTEVGDYAWNVYILANTPVP